MCPPPSLPAASNICAHAEITGVPHLTWTSYFISALPPVTGVLLGAALAFLYTYYFNVRTARNDVLKDFHSDLDKIEELSISYWLGNHRSEDANDKKKLDDVGHQLRAKLLAMVSYHEATESLFNAKKRKEYAKLDTRLLMTATGGDFQTAKMEKSPETYNKIIEVLSEMRVLIRTTRGRLL